ncbi:EF-hand domain-containing family member B isoform X2 [Drosophila eugracilis]|nr:EF-hand domain-containing family member B isoform X2 [Drosophila eugracilis]
MTSELQKSRFMSFKEKFYEEMYFKKSNLGQVKPTYSKPDNVNNSSQTFGCPSSPTPSESLYSIIMPAKSAEQVNKEYQTFHDKKIISHNHYFPSEQINRQYSPPFNRQTPSANFQSLGDFGLKVKRCLEEGESHLKVIGKAQVDFMKRTEAPLGTKFEKYPCAVPDITFGIPMTSNGDVKMLLSNIKPSEETNRLLDAISYLNKKRYKLRDLLDFHKHELMSQLEKSDKDKTGYLPLPLILEIIGSFHIRLDSRKIRSALSHFQMIVDKGCATERVSYQNFLKLLSIQNSLPKMGNLFNASDINCLDTTYRLFCDDRQKKPKVDLKVCDQHLEKDITSVKDLVSPDLAILRGLKPNDFTRLRPKVEIERIFRKLVSKDGFENIWRSLMNEYKVQNEMASVTQFRAKMYNNIGTT